MEKLQIIGKIGREILSGHDGQLSSFRIVWATVIIVVTMTWALMSIYKNTLLPWPFDGTTTVGMFASPGVKTMVERTGNKGE